MATRNELEQEALRQTQRGDYAKAARIYHAILRQQPRDKRARQKLGEIYLKMGQKKEGAKYLKEVAGLSMREGQHRAAIAILRQLSEILGDDLEIIGALAECYRESTQLHEATRVYQTGLNIASSTRAWEFAIAFASALVELQPTDTAVQFRLAELRESAGDVDGALKDYRRMVATFQRRGELAEVARVAETALRLAPDDTELMESAVRARVATGEFERALEVGGALLAILDQQPEPLAEALATALLRAGKEQRARNVFRDIADRYLALGDAEGQVRALKLALEAGADDPGLREAISVAEARSEKLKKRLSSESALSPSSDEELAACTRAEVQARYGFPERALETLQAAYDERPASFALGARQVEILWDLGKRGEALKLLESITRKASGQIREVLATRLIILGGPDLVPAAGGEHGTKLELLGDEDLFDEDTDEKPPWERAGGAEGDQESEDEDLIDDEELLDDEELVDDELGKLPVDSLTDHDPDGADQESPVLEAERLVQAGDLDGAIALLQAAYREDPNDQEVLIRIAEIRRQLREEQARLEAASVAEPDDELLDEPEAGFTDFLDRPTRTRGEGAVSSPLIAGVGKSSQDSVAADPGRWRRLLGGREEAESGPERVGAESDWMSGLGSSTEERSGKVVPPAAGADDPWALATLGRFEQALPAAKAMPGLVGRWIEARCLRALGRGEEALEILADALEEASERDEVYPEALMSLAKLQAGQGRYRAATRTARDLAASFPDWRAGEVAALMRGLGLVR